MGKQAPSCGIKREAKKQADFSWKYSEMNPLKKLDWNVTDEPDLIWMSLALFGGQLTLEA